MWDLPELNFFVGSSLPEPQHPKASHFYEHILYIYIILYIIYIIINMIFPTCLLTLYSSWTEELPGEFYFSSCLWGWLMTRTSQVRPFKTRTNFGEFQSGSPSLANGPPDLDKELQRVEQFVQILRVPKTWDVDWRGPTRQPREDERFGTLPQKSHTGKTRGMECQDVSRTQPL